MGILYNELDFFEFFKKEPEVDHDCKSIDYVLPIDNFILRLRFSLYGQNVSVWLFHNVQGGIFSLDLENIAEMKLDKQERDCVFLRLYKKNSDDPELGIKLAPNISWRYKI